MTMLSIASQQQFFAKTQKLAEEFKRIEQQAFDREQQLITKVNQFTQAVSKAGEAKQSAELQQQLANYFEETSNVLEAWEQKVCKFEAGLQLREKLDDSLLLFVYGKVKAGKSSLGNFMLTGTSTPNEARLAEVAKHLAQPQYYIHEENKEFGEKIRHVQGFKVDQNEATSCIQSFTMPGLTWIDSPGLHSTTEKNGQLAKKYVESADLIIYLMNASAASRQSDLQELELLVEQGKRLLVVITRCDETKRVRNEQGELTTQLVMKSEQSRKDIKEYATQQLQKMYADLKNDQPNFEVLTLSVGYAEQNANTPEAMQESGLADFFAQLDSILTSEGIELKKQTPLNNLQKFYQQLLAEDENSELSIVRLCKPLQQAQVEIEQSKEKLTEIKKHAQNDIDYDFSLQVGTLVEHFAPKKDMKGLNQALEAQIQELIKKHYQQQVNETYQEALATLQAASSNMGLCVGMEFKTNKETISFDVTYKNVSKGAGLGGILGGIGGFMLGGPLGAAVGSGLGGVAGGAIGSAFSEQEYTEIENGNNNEELKTRLVEKGRQLIQTKLNELNNQALQQVFEPIEQAINSILEQANILTQYVQEQRHV